MASNHGHPAGNNGQKLLDTIVLNGRVEMIGYEDTHHESSYVGVREVELVPTFSGYAEKTISEFAFCPEMEEKIGWREKVANVRFAFAENKIDPHDVAETAIMSYYGLVEQEFYVHWSELSGYLWTDEEFKVGGHSLIGILKSHLGEWVHMEIELFET